MPSQDLQQLGRRLAAAEKDLAAARRELAMAREISGVQRRRYRRWLAAILAGGVVSAMAVLPVWRASAQAPSTTDAQLLDLTNRVTALETVKTENLSDRIRKVSDSVGDLKNQVLGIAEELSKDIARTNGRIDALAVESGKLPWSPHKIQAPFTVVDAGGQAIFQVLDATGGTFRGAFVFNKSNTPVASLEVSPEGIGAVRARASGKGSAVLFAEEGIGGVLRIRGQAGEIVGEVTETGFNYFGSGGNHTAISRLTEERGRGLVAVYGKSGTPFAFLTESDKHSGGNVTVNDPGGSGVFSAGYVGDGANACVDQPKHGLKCMGIGLPMTFSVAK